LETSAFAQSQKLQLLQKKRTLNLPNQADQFANMESNMKKDHVYATDTEFVMEIVVFVMKLLDLVSAKELLHQLLYAAVKEKETLRFAKERHVHAKKVKQCNIYRDYPTRDQCHCHIDFYFMSCKKNKKTGKKACGCRNLNEKCAMNTSVKRGTCFCSLRDNTFACTTRTVNGISGSYCTCQKKASCSNDTPLTRDSCKCWRRPTTDLQDENSEKKRVQRSFGWKKCKPSDPKNKNSPRVCTCTALKCFEAGRFKKYFCKCPRKTTQYCNKKTDFCKCLPKKPTTYRYKGNYLWIGMITTKDKIIASFKYEKRLIKVWTEDGKKKMESRYIFVDHQNGTFRVVLKPTINEKSKKDMRKEMALYDKMDQNYKNIQKQILKPGKLDKKKK